MKTDVDLPKINFENVTIEQKDLIKRYDLPKEVKFCKKCTISNQRPRIHFDSEGVCSACRYAEKKHKTIDWKDREKQFIKLCDKYRRKDGHWDVVVPSSGGKDSLRVAHMLKYKYKMHPLTVTWASALNTDVGVHNFESMVHAGFDNITGTPNGIVHRKLTRLAFELVGDPFLPFIYGQMAFPMQIATKYKIPLVMFGENGEVEYGGSSKHEDSPEYKYNIKNYYSGIGVERWKEYGFTDEDLNVYKFPSLKEMEEVGVQCYFFGYYHKWIPRQNYEYAVKHTKFKARDKRSEGTYTNFASLDDKIDGIHYYLSFVKFGIGRTTADTAHEIRDGYMTREKAITLIKKYDSEFPKRHFKEFLSYTGMTEKHFWKVIDSWRSHHIWDNVDGKWKLKKAIYDALKKEK